MSRDFGPDRIWQAKALGHIFQSHLRRLRQMLLQPLEVVPLRDRRGDQEEEILVQRHDRHFGDDAALVVGEIAKADAAGLRHDAGDQRRQPVARAFALQPEAREAGQVENAGGIAHGQAFLADALLPRAVAPEGLRRFFRNVVAGLGVPGGALPAIIGVELRAERRDPVVDRRQLLVAAGRPGMARKMDRIFVAIDFHALGDAVVRVGGKGGEAARIAGPHVPFGLALRHPFGQHLAGAAGLGDAEGEDAGLEGVGHAGHRADQRIAVGRIGDRAVDDLAQAGGAEDRHARDGVVEIMLQPVEIVGEKLERKIVRHRIVVGRPMGAAVALVGAEIHAVLFLPQVVGGIDVAQQRQLAACSFDQAASSGISSNRMY